jgi:hypothetical protein
MLFSEDAQWLTAQIDVLSNAAPYNIWGANIELYLMAENDESYTYAGTLAYDPEDPYTEEFSTLETFVPDNIAEKMIKGTPVYAMIKISEQKEYGVFWIDNIQFCDDQGLCNFYCNNISSTEEDTFKEKPLPLPQETVLKTSWLYDDNEIMNNQNELGGKITNKETIEITFDAELVISSPLGENIKIYVGSYSLMPEESSTFSIPSNSLPFFNYNFILKAQLKLTEHRVIQENETQDAIYMSSEKFFKFNNDDTINIFNWSYLFENYDGVLFDAASSPPSSLLPTEEMVTDDGTITVTTLLVQLQDVDIDLDNWDTEISTDMDTESGSDNDTDSTIIQID